MNFLEVLFYALALPSSSGSRNPTLSGLLDPDHEDIEMLRNLGTYLLFENA
jgi:hypothetical protein